MISAPPLNLRCLDGPPEVYTGPYVTLGRKADWPTFARWHFRGLNLGPVRQVLLLHNEKKPIGICVLGFGSLSCRARNLTFGIKAQLTKAHCLWINHNFTRALRLVIDPHSRHHGYGPALLHAAAVSAPTPWVELVSQHPALSTWAEAAGFVPGTTDNTSSSRNSPYRQSRSLPATYADYFHKDHARHLGYFIYDNRSTCWHPNPPAPLERAVT